jgi:hypothetical protein
MNPQFETISAANSYFAFKDNISNVASFLKLDTVIDFTVLSKFYNNILNNPKSSFGKHFWKKFAIQNQNIKKFKGKTINYKFKMVLEKVKEMKRTTSVSKWYFQPNCEKCNKRCCPDEILQWQLNDNGDHYCNCEFVKCITKRDFLASKYKNKIKKLNRRREYLIKQLDENYSKTDDAFRQKEEFDNMPSFKSLIPILKNLKKNARYKSTRSQSQRLYLEVKRLYQEENNERPNMNYKAPPDNKDDDDLGLNLNFSDTEDDYF